MTICIAAIAENRFVVMAADRTLTLMLEPEEFAHKHSSKLYEVDPTFIIGSSGSPLWIPEFLSSLSQKNVRDRPPLERLSEALRVVRRDSLERAILHRFGLTYEEYEKALTSGRLSEAQARIIGEGMDELHVCLHVVAGAVGKEGKASVFSAEDCGMTPAGRMPKAVFCHDSIGWVSTGSGASYAEQALIRASCASDMALSDVIFHVFEAKKNAEQAIGVGAETDLRIIAPTGNLRMPDDELRSIGRVLQNAKKRQTTIQNSTLLHAKKAVEESVRRAATLESGGASRRSGRVRTG